MDNFTHLTLSYTYSVSHMASKGANQQCLVVVKASRWFSSAANMCVAQATERAPNSWRLVVGSVKVMDACRAGDEHPLIVLKEARHIRTVQSALIPTLLFT